MLVEELQPGDTIDGFIVYDFVQPRFGCDDQVEVPLLIPLPSDRWNLGYKEYEGKYYPIIHPYTFPKNTILDENRYSVIKKGNF